MNQLAVVNDTGLTQSASLGFEPQSMKEAWRLAEIVVASGLGPKSVRSPEAAMIIIITGRELGLTAMQSLRSIHVVEGKPVLDATLIMALCLRLPVCEMFTCVETSGAIATFVAKRRGQPETRLSFTIEQARAAGLIGKDNWKKYPDAMLRARCIAALARVAFADAMLGVYERDELPASDEPRAVLTEVRSVPESRPTPVTASGARPTNTIETEVANVAAEMEAAADMVALNATAAKVNALKSSGLTEEQRAGLMRLYSTRKAEITTPKAVAAEPADDDGAQLGHELDAPHMREPGED